MAFDYTNLYPDTSANGGYTKSWNYTTVVDSIATCSASGYFNKVATRLGIGDNIIIARVDAFDTKNRTTLLEKAELFVTGISGGVVTTTNYANFDSPAFTGTPTAPTASALTNNTQIATTAYADAGDTVVAATAAAATALKANIASPTFTGVPAAPTAAVDTNTTQLATTAMVLAQAASATPLIDGVAAVGTSTRFARGDHVHPVDTSRQSATGTTTNDNAAAGKLGEYLATGTGNSNASATVTMTIAAPCVVTWTSHGFTVGTVTTAVKFTTTGALPTGVTSGTTYYIKPIDANTFNIATTADNALAGTFITTTGSQSGTHTGDIRVSMTTVTAQNLAAISLTAGDWELSGQVLKGAAATTTVTYYLGSLSTTSATIDRTFGRVMSLQYGGLALNNNEFTVFGFAPARFSLSATTTIYLVGFDSFGTSTLTASGWLRARRPR